MAGEALYLARALADLRALDEGDGLTAAFGLLSRHEESVPLSSILMALCGRWLKPELVEDPELPGVSAAKYAILRPA